jgi:hypothetical protein
VQSGKGEIGELLLCHQLTTLTVIT